MGSLFSLGCIYYFFPCSTAFTASSEACFNAKVSKTGSSGNLSSIELILYNYTTNCFSLSLSWIITVTAVPPPLSGDGGMADRQRSTGNSQFLINGFSDKINVIII